MNIIDILKQDKSYQLAEKIESYGRKIVVVDGKPTVFSSVVSEDGYKAREDRLIDFKALDKGCESYILGEKYPMRFCLSFDKMVILTQMKRLIPTILRTVGRSKIVSFLYLRKNWTEYVNFMHYVMRDVFAEVNFYNQPTRELYRVLSNRGIDNVRDILCAVVEYDTAYRYRFQDIVARIDQQNFERNPVKEIKRLIEIYQSREQFSDMVKMKFGKSLPFLLFYLHFNRKLLKEIKSIVRQLDLNEIKSSVEDIYWQSKTHEVNGETRWIYEYNFNDEIL